jgi:transposase InsO family protein
MNAATRAIIGYRISDNRGVGHCIMAMRMAFQHLKELPKNFKFIADAYSAYPLAAQQFFLTYKASYRPTNGFDGYNGANYDLALWVAYYNFLRPHKYNSYKPPVENDIIRNGGNMLGKWQLMIYLGQQVILKKQQETSA